MTEWLRKEPWRVQVVAMLLIAGVTRLGFHIGPIAELLIEGAALWFSAEVGRLFTTPYHPSAAGVPAPSRKDQVPMNIEAFVTAAKAKAEEAAARLKALFEALPVEFQHPALEAAQAGVNDLVDLAATEIEKVAPPSIDALIEAEKAKAQAIADAKIAALETLKSTVAA